jgi:anti-anti-sigma factor
MDIETIAFEGWRIVVLDGRFVIKYLGKVRRKLEKIEKRPRPLVAFDLTKTTWMDSGAITLVLNFCKRIRGKSGNLALFGANRDITGIIAIVGLDTKVRCYGSAEDFRRTVLGGAF